MNEEILGGEDTKEEVDKVPAEFIISVIQYVDINGNTYVYMGTEDGTVYKALFSANEQLLFAEVGDVVKGSVVNGELIIQSIKEQKIDAE